MAKKYVVQNAQVLEVVSINGCHTEKGGRKVPDETARATNGEKAGKLRPGREAVTLTGRYNEKNYQTTGTDGVGGRQYICGALPSHPPHPLGASGRDRSSARRAWVCRCFSFCLEGIGPVCASLGTGSPGGGYSPAVAAGATAQPYPGLDYAAAYHGSALALLLCVGLDGCGGVWTGRPGMTHFRPSVPSRSRYMSGFCCTSGWHG